MSWKQVCDECAAVMGEMKTIGIIAIGDGPCAACGKMLGIMKNGLRAGNPASESQVAAIVDGIAKLAAAAPALLRALVSVEWKGHECVWQCPTCDADPRCAAGYRHFADCPLDAALTAAGLPDQSSRDEARKRIAGGETCAD